jgi:hypothetical protein
MLLLIQPTHPVTFLSFSLFSLLLFPPFDISGPCTLRMYPNTTRDTVGPRHLSILHRLGHHHRLHSPYVLGMRELYWRRSRMAVCDGGVLYSSVLPCVYCSTLDVNVCVQEIINIASYLIHSPCHRLPFPCDFLSSPSSLPYLGPLHSAHAHQHHS